MNCMRIDGRLIGTGQHTLVIAEIGVNHDGRLDRALKLVEHAANAGADAVKLQIFRAGALMHPTSSFASYQKQNVAASDPSAMLSQYELSEPDLRRLVDAIVAQDMMPIATPFSPSDVEMIERLRLPAIKIASPDVINHLLISRAAATRKPLIISTGAATMQEIEESYDWLSGWGTQFALMHCVSSYPTPSSEAHLGWIRQLAKFDVPLGYSDHTVDLIAGALAVAAGACIIEKHLTYDRSAKGPDHAASAGPDQFAEYVRLIRNAQAMCGGGTKHVLPIEREIRTVSRQSLVLVREIADGEPISANDLTVQRPGTGIAPSDVSVAVGRVAKQRLPKGTLLQWDMLTEAA